MDELKGKLLKANKDGNFFEFIQEIYYQDRKGEKLLASALAELHNDGDFNLVGLFKNFNNTPENHDFFSVRRVSKKFYLI